MLKKLFKKRKMYAVVVKWYDTNEITLIKYDSVGLNNFGMYEYIDYEIIDVMEI
jgi:hypothetical protein